MSYKTILLSLNEIGRNAELVPAVARFAASQEAHVIGLYVLPGITIYPDAAFTAFPDYVDFNRRHYENARENVEKHFNDIMRKEGVAHEFFLVDSNRPAIADEVLANSRHADLLIVSATDGKDLRGVEPDFVEGIAVASGRPVMVVPRNGELVMNFAHILLAWNDSRESSRAAFDALPLLKEAKTVHVTRIDPQLRGNMPGVDIAETLARHGVKCEVSSVSSDGLLQGEALLRAARDQGSGLIVMGAYGHSRLREFIFGGVTRHVVEHLDRPVLMSH